MVKKSVKAEINTFVKGFITEASPLNFPENASVVDENFEIKRDGTRRRRLGLDYENGYSLKNLGISYSDYNDIPFSTYVWKNAGGIVGKDFLVFQSGNTAFVFDVSVKPISNAGFVGSFDLSSIGGYGNKFSMVSVDNKLVTVAGTGIIAVTSYDGSSFTTVGDRIKIRDQWGIQNDDTDSDPYYRPEFPSDAHWYNLYNQSWGIPRRTSSAIPAVYNDPVYLYTTAYSKFPSNSETVWVGLQTLPNGSNPASDVMVTTSYADLLGSQTVAPKGHFIIDMLERGTSRKQVIVDNAERFPELTFDANAFTPVEDKTTNGASCICEYAGRVFYSGFNGELVDGDKNSPDLSNYIAFSQLVRNGRDVFKCYQEGDPTSRESNDVVDTDGGIIRISNAKGINRLVDLGNALIVFAKNGVWSVTGGSDYGFSATNYKVDQITTLGLSSPDSVIVDGNKVYYWSAEGIVVIGRDQTGILTSQNITINTIQSYYNGITEAAKQSVIGVYDSANKKLRWMCREGVRSFLGGKNFEIVFDLTLGAFTINRLSGPSFRNTAVLGAFSYDPVIGVSHDGLEEIDKVSHGYILSTTAASSVIFTVGYYNNTEFKDWKALDGVGADAEANLITGKLTAQDSSVMKQVPYLITHFKQTETGFDMDYNLIKPSGCLLRSMWDFTNSESSNKWSPFFQAYRYRRAYIPTGFTMDNGYDLVTSKSKLRGSGKALSLHFKSEPGKDCRIVGWNLSINGNSVA